jgi:hypothetical protein
MIWKLKKRRNSVLGLTLSDGQLRAVHAARPKGAVVIVKTASAALSLDLLHPEPDLIGREIKNHLDAAGIRERNCVVSIPANWIMSQHTRLPELSAEDLDSFLQIESEKGFPCDTEQLQIARSFQKTQSGSYVTQLAVRKERLDQLGAVIKAAGLKPLSLTLGLAALDGVIAPAGSGRITVAVEPKGAALLISAGGGIAALRTSDASIESEAGEKVVNGAAVARELRITVEQLSSDLRSELSQLSLCGDEAMVGQLAESLGEWPKIAGLKVERAGAAGDKLSDRIAEGVARHWLTPTGNELEYLAPHAGPLATLLAQYSSKRFGTAGIAVGAVAAVVLMVFGWQQFELSSLRSEWNAMQPQVASLSSLQDRIRAYRPWYDRSFPDLRILARITQCFPDNGSVTAKTFGIQKTPTGTIINITGTVTDDRALLYTQDQLHKAKEIEGVKLEAISGKLPSRFSITFRWIGGPAS